MTGFFFFLEGRGSLVPKVIVKDIYIIHKYVIFPQMKGKEG